MTDETERDRGGIGAAAAKCAPRSSGGDGPYRDSILSRANRCDWTARHIFRFKGGALPRLREPVRIEFALKNASLY